MKNTRRGVTAEKVLSKIITDPKKDGTPWTLEEATEALEIIVRQGLLEKLDDGTYRPTEEGRLVVHLERQLEQS